MPQVTMKLISAALSVLVVAPLSLATGTAFAQGSPPLAPLANPSEAPPPLAPLANPSEAPPLRLRRSEGMRTGGIVLTAVASAALAIGTPLFAVGVAGVNQSRLGDSTFIGSTTNVAVGLSMMLGSALLASVGVPLWVVGSRPRSAPVPRAAWTLPALLVSPSGMALRW
jgi:hypothetical protein